MRLPAPNALPAPDAAALAHCARVIELLRTEIAAAGGSITFARYMHLALYAPGLGYYAAGARKFGAAGDFVTAPEMTPLFAQALAVQVAAILDATHVREIVEFGAGTGVLAADLLNALALRGEAPSRYVIVDVSPDLRQRQRVTIAACAPALADRVHWADGPPRAIDGAVILNEVLDAVPPHILTRRGGAWFERAVAWRDGFAWNDRPLPEGPLRVAAGERFPAEGDYTSEINPGAEALIETMGGRMQGGALLACDYGFPQAEFYHPQRSDGTLMGHYRHHAHADPFLWPGLCDLTSHIDFTAMALAGERGGLSVAGYASQASFLIGCGILDRLRDAGDPASADYIRAAGAVQNLLHPAQMGELCKVLALAKSDDIAWPGYATGDLSHRL